MNAYLHFTMPVFRMEEKYGAIFELDESYVLYFINLAWDINESVDFIKTIKAALKNELENILKNSSKTTIKEVSFTHSPTNPEYLQRENVGRANIVIKIKAQKKGSSDTQHRVSLHSIFKAMQYL